MSGVDVLILGAGPAGSALAAQIATTGARVLVVDRQSFPRDKVCGEFVSARGVGVLDRLGVLDDLLDAGAHRIDALALTDRRGATVRGSLTGEGFALGVSRERMDAALLELAARRGAAVRERWRAKRPWIEDGRVVGCLGQPVGSSGPEERIRARVVVAADGRRSMLVRHLHPRRGDPARSTPGSRFGLKTHFAGPGSLGESEVQLHVFDGGYAGLACVEAGRINVCLLSRISALRDCGGSPDRLLERRVRANPSFDHALGDARRATPWHSVGPLRFGARLPASHGALFVGDAAGTLDPFCGEGMGHALGASELAAPLLAEALEAGGLTDAQARRYTQAWKARFSPVTTRVRWLGRVLERSGWATTVLGLLRGPAETLLPRLVSAASSRASTAGAHSARDARTR